MEFQGTPASAPAESQGSGEQGSEQSRIASEGQQIPPQQPQQQQEDPADEYYRRIKMINRKEREMIEQRKRYQTMEQKNRELQEKLDRYESLRGNIERDPEALLKAYDLDVDKFSSYLINNNGNITKDHFLKVDDEVRKVRDEFSKFREEQIEERNRNIYNGFTSEVSEFVQNNADRFPILSEESDADERIFNKIRDHWYETAEYSHDGVGKFLSIEEACDMLDKELANDMMKRLQSEKRRKALGIDFASQMKIGREDNNQTAPRQQSENTFNTLSSRHSNQSSPPSTKRFYTKEERDESIKRMLFGE